MLVALVFALFAADADLVTLITDVGGVKQEIAARKGKVVVIKFWATWCTPCVETFPEFVKTAKAFPDKDVAVMTISVDLKQGLKNEVIPFLRAQQAPFPAYLLDVEDPAPVMSSVDRDWEGALPATFVFDRKGVLKKRLLGKAIDLKATVQGLIKH